MRRVTAARATAIGFALAAVVAGCGSGGGAAAPPHPHAQTAASPTRAEPQLRVVADDVSLASVQQKIAQLYRNHPAVASYSTQDVAYTSRSRTRVLRACSGQGASATQQVETARVLACAPLVYFYYQYGRAKGVSEATGVADSIYSYASTQINGPSDPRTLLDGVLEGWGLPVPAGNTAPRATTPAATALIAAVRHAIGVRHSVRVTITGYQGSAQPRERIVSDTGRDASAEVLRAGSAYAEIRIVNGAAYVNGNPTGLRHLIGLPKTAASAARGHWLQAPSGSAAARNLSAENSLPALASGILPGVEDRVQVSSRHRGATTIKVLRWSATAANGIRIHASLTVTSGTSPLPISETTTAARNRQTARFTRWNTPVTVTAPTGAVPLPSGG